MSECSLDAPVPADLSLLATLHVEAGQLSGQWALFAFQDIILNCHGLTECKMNSFVDVDIKWLHLRGDLNLDRFPSRVINPIRLDADGRPLTLDPAIYFVLGSKQVFRRCVAWTETRKVPVDDCSHRFLYLGWGEPVLYWYCRRQCEISL
jgi:hypothetical protein